MVWEVRSDGDDANGGAFKTGASGTDYSQQASPHVTIDGATITAVVHTTTTQLNITGYTVAAGDVGNVVNINGGTATAGRYEITAVDTVNNRWTLDRSAGTSTQTATGRMGGCVKFLSAILLTGGTGVVFRNTVWCKAGVVTLTTSTPGPGGPVNWTAGGVAVKTYTTTRGDGVGYYELNAGAITNITLLTLNTYSGWFERIIANGNSGTGVNGFNGSGGQRADHLIECIAKNCNASSTTYGFSSFSTGLGLYKCSAQNCGRGFYLCSHACYCCEAVNNVDGFTSCLGMIRCLSRGNTTDGFVAADGALCIECTADGNGRYGFNLQNASSIARKCLATNHTGVGDSGFNADGGYGRAVDCYSYNNTSAISNETSPSLSNVTTLTEDPYVDRSNGDFRLNDTTGGGAVLRAAGIGVYGQTNNFDAGAVQHSDPTGGGGTTVIVVEDD